MSRNPNRHKRQRSSAQNVTFHTQDNDNQFLQNTQAYPHLETHPPFPSNDILPGNSRWSVGRDAGVSDNQPSLVHESLDINPQNAGIGGALPEMQEYFGSAESGNLQPNFALAGFDMFPKPPASPEENLPFADDVGNLPFQMPFSGGFSKHSHTKNISISSHLDMFSLGGDYGKFEVQQPENIPPGTSKAESTPKKIVSPAKTRHSNFSAHDHELSQQVIHGLIPLFSQSNVSNFHKFLLAVLKDKRIWVPTDDLYNLLFNAPNFDQYFRQTPLDSKIDRSSPTGSHPAGILVNQRVLELFEHPEDCLQSTPSQREKIASIKTQELLRSFLALKIITSFVVYEPKKEPEVRAASEEPSGSPKKASDKSALPRVAIYKMYYILCRMLIQKYTSSAAKNDKQQKVILGNAIIGKLIKLVYPDVKSKRLGSRGDSKYNYLGMSWNESIVSDYMQRLCHHELSEIDQSFLAPLSEKAAVGTYFPLSNCDPTYWGKSGPNSAWFQTVKAKSMKILTESGMQTLFTESQILRRHLSDRKWIRENIIESLRISRQDQYHSILFLLSAQIFQLLWNRILHKQELSKMTEHVTSEMNGEDQALSRLLKKLVVLADSLEPKNSPDALSVKMSITDVLSCIKPASFQVSISHCVFHALQAFDLVEKTRMDLVDRITESLCVVSNILWAELITVVERPSSSMAQLARVLPRVIHQEILTSSWILEIPIPAAVEIFMFMTSTGQKAVYEMDKDPEVFRLWSFLTYSAQAYMTVLSEIVCIGQTIGRA